MICDFHILSDSYPKSNFIICGDFNDFPISDFRHLFLSINRVESATRSTSCTFFLDQIWISESSQEQYPAASEVVAPLSTSDHNCVIRSSARASGRDNVVLKPVFDFRQAHIHNFLWKLSTDTFEELYTTSDVNIKCELFHKLF